jgi:hypothetical protein
MQAILCLFLFHYVIHHLFDFMLGAALKFTQLGSEVD